MPMDFINETRFKEFLQKFPSLRVLVVGDFFLDKYLSLDPALSEISLETGLEAYQVVEIRHSPGAAGTVVSNLRALEVKVAAVGVIGRDGEGYDLKQGLTERGVNVEGLLETPDRFTPT
ncbi:MAG TPA: carbohydrate kinase, partial [Anaerolineae bacterium]|nr:carbohydrate kinase [Anaerolineae bacterium]